MKVSKLKLAVLIMSVLLITAFATAVYAVDTGSVYNTDGTLFASGIQILMSPQKQLEIMMNEPNYLYGYNGVLYSMADANAAYVESGQNMAVFAQRIALRTPVAGGQDPTDDSFHVIEIR